MMKGSERLTGPQGLRRENEALRDRISRLSAAVLRISASLDLDTVLHEIVESARAVTGARYGCITTIDDKGGVRDFVTSGITAEEHRRLAAWSDGRQLFEHLRDLPGPLTLGKTRDYVRSLGFSTDLLPSGTLQATPMRHRGAHIGNFFLADKAGGREFTDEDEETLVLFASQAAAAIANARTHRRERRARADLEALVDTCPVGVAVFDARTGQPVSLNREARRIVGRLHAPGEALEAEVVVEVDLLVPPSPLVGTRQADCQITEGEAVRRGREKPGVRDCHASSMTHAAEKASARRKPPRHRDDSSRHL